ncbi:hypothetical protein [Sutcliffiella halmapala]|uniref:hypothetical protein n=1 Tax=Sutcliffiella halmapala TaxID=79882 RepID=UPI000994F65C|nr:hypothetical protein [Sutcliffiella halmapala]
MSLNTKVSLIVSLTVLIGLPVIFLVVSLVTNEWRFLTFSIIPSFFAGFTGLIFALQQRKKDRITN